MSILVFNAGSSSLKFALYSGTKFRLVVAGEYQRIGQADPVCVWQGKKKKHSRQVGQRLSHGRAGREIIVLLRDNRFLTAPPDIIGHRMVHGGNLFFQPTLITRQRLNQLNALSGLAPLHNPPTLFVIEEMMKKFPQSKNIAVFDTGFFHALPETSRYYALPLSVQTKYGIRRFGFHGIAHEYARDEAGRILKRPARTMNIITVHLGAGCSAAAIRQGRPIDTTMGFTPLEGLMMATRAGDLGPEVILTLEDRGWSRTRLRQLFNHGSGWFGLTGLKDFREVLSVAGYPVSSSGRRANAVLSASCRLAADMFLARTKKTIAGYAALLGRVDAVVFTGAIGSGNPWIRKEVLRGIVLPKTARLLSVPANETLMIARQLRKMSK